MNFDNFASHIEASFVQGSISRRVIVPAIYDTGYNYGSISCILIRGSRQNRAVEAKEETEWDPLLTVRSKHFFVNCYKMIQLKGLSHRHFETF